MKKTFEEIKFKIHEKEFLNKKIDVDLIEICKNEITLKDANIQKTVNISTSDLLDFSEIKAPIDIITQHNIITKIGDNGWL